VVISKRIDVAGKGLLSAVVLSAMWVYPGCGTGEYNKRLDEWVQSGGQVGGAGLTPVPGTNVRLRIPADMTLASEGAQSPALLDAAGLKAAFEGSIEVEGGGKLPYYCYVVVPGAKSEDALQAIHKNAQGAQGFTISQEMEDFEANSKKWKRFRATGAQSFQYTGSDQQETREMDGVLEYWAWLDAPETGLIVVWRMPDYLKDYIGLDKMGPRLAGSVQVSEAAEEESEPAEESDES